MHIPIGIREARRFEELVKACDRLMKSSLDVTRDTIYEELRKVKLSETLKFWTVHQYLLAGLSEPVAVVVRQVLAAQNRLEGPEWVPTLFVRHDPTLTIREQREIVLESLMPTPPIVGDAKFPTTLLTVANDAAIYLNEVKQLKNRAPIIDAQLDAVADHLLYRVVTEGSTAGLTQKEKSFLLLRFDPFYSRDEGEGDEPSGPHRLPQPVFNPTVMEHAQPLFAAVLDTSKMKLLTKLSTGERFDICMSITPYRSKNFVTRGFIEAAGGALHIVDFEQGQALPWDITEQITAVAGLGPNVVLAPIEGDCTARTLTLWTGPTTPDYRRGGHECRIVLDHLEYRYDERQGTLVYQKVSPMRDNKTYIGNDPEVEILDWAITPDQVNETPMANEGFDRFHDVNLKYAKKAIVSLGTFEDPVNDARFRVLYFASEEDIRNKKLSEKYLPSAPLMGFASHFARPPLAPFVKLTNKRLYEPQPEGRAYALQYLELPIRMQHRNELAFDMCYNAYLLRVLYGRDVPDLRDRILSHYSTLDTMGSY